MVRGDSQCQPLLRVLAQQDYDLTIVRDDSASKHLLPSPNLDEPLKPSNGLTARRHGKHNRHVDSLLPHQGEYRQSHRHYRIRDDRHSHHQLPPRTSERLPNLVQNIVLAPNDPDVRFLLHSLLLVDLRIGNRSYPAKLASRYGPRLYEGDVGLGLVLCQPKLLQSSPSLLTHNQ